MAQWVLSTSGYINLDHVAEVRHKKDGKLYCFDDDGAMVGEIYSRPQSGIVVPNSTDIHAISFWPDGHAVEVIVAWVVEDQSAIPVFTEIGLEDGVYCLEIRAGDAVNYVFPEDRSFHSRDEAIAYGIAYAKKQETEREERRAARREARQKLTT